MVNTLGSIPLVRADEFRLPIPGVLVPLSSAFNPPILKGIRVHPENPFRFDFILDQGSSPLLNKEGIKGSSLKEESTKLIKYFLASLTIPEKDLWVNLSPYEKNRIIPHSFGLTEMGRDLLAEDYMLKQITASLMYPEGETGKKFWQRIYQEAARRFGTTNIPVNTFNKVWIIPDKAIVYENAQAGTAYVVEAKLKVMLEEDYLSLTKHIVGVDLVSTRNHHGERKGIMSPTEILREIIIPQLTKEVNEGQNFAQLRQVYNSLILAEWYKKKIHDSILIQVYENKNKVSGILSSPNVLIGDPEHIYQQYLKAFKKGAYNYIKEETDLISQQAVFRKYFSGGIAWGGKNLDLAIVTQPFKAGAYFEASHDMAIAVEVKDMSQSVESINTMVFDDSHQVREAHFSYDQWGQLSKVVLVKGNPEGKKAMMQYRLNDDGVLNFEYDGVIPRIWIDYPDGRQWVFSGYVLEEKNLDGTSKVTHLEIKNFGGKYLALESDSHDTMYDFLRVFQKKRVKIGSLINIDLHHDMNVSQIKADGNILNYSNWVYHTLDKVKKILWVYPSWYDLSDKDKEITNVDNFILMHDLDEINPLPNTVVTIDFDYISQKESPSDQERIKKEVLKIVNFIDRVKGSLIGINLNHSAFSIRESENHAPRESSRYILNFFVYELQRVLGPVALTKVHFEFDPLKPTLEIHRNVDVAMSSEKEKIDRAMNAKVETIGLFGGLEVSRHDVETVFDIFLPFMRYQIEEKNKSNIIKLTILFEKLRDDILFNHFDKQVVFEKMSELFRIFRINVKSDQDLPDNLGEVVGESFMKTTNGIWQLINPELSDSDRIFEMRRSGYGAEGRYIYTQKDLTGARLLEKFEEIERQARQPVPIEKPVVLQPQRTVMALNNNQEMSHDLVNTCLVSIINMVDAFNVQNNKHREDFFGKIGQLSSTPEIKRIKLLDLIKRSEHLIPDEISRKDILNVAASSIVFYRDDVTLGIINPGKTSDAKTNFLRSRGYFKKLSVRDLSLKDGKDVLDKLTTIEQGYRQSNIIVKTSVAILERTSVDKKCIGFSNILFMDSAMVTRPVQKINPYAKGKYGGIDMSAENALLVQNGGQGIQFHIDPAMLRELQDTPGFTPVIINIQPLRDINAFLGLNKAANDNQAGVALKAA